MKDGASGAILVFEMNPLHLVPALCIVGSLASAQQNDDVWREPLAEVQRVCAIPSAKASGQCDAARQMVSRAQAVASMARACRTSSCTIGQRRAVVEAASRLGSDFFLGYEKKYQESLGLFEGVDEALKGSAALKQASERFIWRGLQGLDGATSRLETRMSSAEKGLKRPAGARAQATLREIDAQGGLDLKDFLGLSLLIDDDNNVLPKDPRYQEALDEREGANDIARRLIKVRDRLIALQQRLGLREASPVSAEQLSRAETVERSLTSRRSPGPRRLPSAGPGFDSSEAASAAGPAGAVQAPSQSRAPIAAVPDPRPTSLTEFAPAPPPPWSVPMTAFSAGDARHTEDPAELARIEQLHRLGLYHTAGNPQLLGHFVHAQQGGDCSIVTQEEVLEILGRQPGDHPLRLEDKLLGQAERQGFITATNQGVMPVHQGGLLTANGIPVVKHYYDPQEGWKFLNSELDRTLKKGRVAIASVDAGILWNDPHFLGGGHSILVTGAEVNRLTGRVVGYYINDSGSQPPMGDRLVSADQFRRAFDSSVGGDFVEVVK